MPPIPQMMWMRLIELTAASASPTCSPAAGAFGSGAVESGAVKSGAAESDAAGPEAVKPKASKPEAAGARVATAGRLGSFTSFGASSVGIRCAGACLGACVAHCSGSSPFSLFSHPAGRPFAVAAGKPGMPIRSGRPNRSGRCLGSARGERDRRLSSETKWLRGKMARYQQGCLNSRPHARPVQWLLTVKTQ